LKLEDATDKFVNKNNKREYNKFGFSNINALPSQLKDIFIYLNSKEFITKIEKLTGITGIICGDYNLRGAGVHMIKNRGYLGMHTDFNTYYHPRLGKLDRRINLLIYMNKDWGNDYGGELLMYDPSNTQTQSEVKCIQPIFNRAVIFNTTNKSVHGHPKPLNVPSEDIYRKSIAVYYYTKNTSVNVDFEGDKPHSTIWHRTPSSP
jgi:Rps23 Pro-64 3,4-dihydroxylase Tpa1-like proline 4-hydroxylase